MTHLEGLNAGILWLIKPVRHWYGQVERSVFNCSGMSENYTFFWIWLIKHDNIQLLNNGCRYSQVLTSSNDLKLFTYLLKSFISFIKFLQILTSCALPQLIYRQKKYWVKHEMEVCRHNKPSTGVLTSVLNIFKSS